jgi:hypothetical protein
MQATRLQEIMSMTELAGMTGETIVYILAAA